MAAQSHIPVLAVEDYGTTGLVGPAEPGKPFYALVKSSGVSQKADAHAGGSFGIGKNAAFAISSLRTVFYSTVYSNAGERNHLVQGKSILVSHSEEGLSKRANGYWGAPNYGPVVGTDGLPDWLIRSENGTTVATVGFIDEEDWNWQVVESLVRNFFSAITAGSVRFTVHGSRGEPVEITAANVESVLALPEVLAAAETAGTVEDLAFSRAMLAALTSEAPNSEEKEFPYVGKLRIRLLQGDGFPKRVGILRNGMYIADNLKHFGHPLARFALSRDFVAIVEPADLEASARIREMENPKHDEISAERFDDLVQRDRIRRSMKKVGQWIRDVIKATTTKPAEGEILLDEMNRFFSKPGENPPVQDPTAPDTDPERIKISPRTARERGVGAGPDGASGSGGGVKESTTEGGRTSGGRRGGGRGAQGGRGGRNISYSSLRNVLAESSASQKRIISFTPNGSGPAVLELSAIGVSGDEHLGVAMIGGVPCKRSPSITLTEGKRERLEVTFDRPYSGPIGMVLSVAEEKSDAN